MRGSPLLRAAIVFVALLALGPLLRKLTRADAVPAVVKSDAAQPPPARARVALALTFSTSAKKAVITHLGREVWSKLQPDLAEEAVIELRWPKEGVELRAVVVWPESAPASAMRVKLSDPAGNEHDRTVWGRGSVAKVLVFP